MLFIGIGVLTFINFWWLWYILLFIASSCFRGGEERVLTFLKKLVPLQCLGVLVAFLFRLLFFERSKCKLAYGLLTSSSRFFKELRCVLALGLLTLPSRFSESRNVC